MNLRIERRMLAARSRCCWPRTGLLLSGCSLPLPQAQADRPGISCCRGPAGAGGGRRRGAVCVIRIERVDVPAYLLDKPLAVRRGPNEVRYLEAARWAEPLDQEPRAQPGARAGRGDRAWPTIARGSRAEKLGLRPARPGDGVRGRPGKTPVCRQLDAGAGARILEAARGVGRVHRAAISPGTARSAGRSPPPSARA